MIGWKNFNCVYANSVAQVYQRAALPANGRVVKPKAGDPVGHFKPGDCFVTHTTMNSGKWQQEIYSLSDPIRLDIRAAIDTAVWLFNEVSDEERFGDDPHSHLFGQYRLYANPVYDVLYWSMDGERCDKPFVLIHRVFGKLLRTKAGHIHRFATLAAANDKADKLIKGMRFE